MTSKYLASRLAVENPENANFKYSNPGCPSEHLLRFEIQPNQTEMKPNYIHIIFYHQTTQSINPTIK